MERFSAHPSQHFLLAMQSCCQVVVGVTSDGSPVSFFDIGKAGHRWYLGALTEEASTHAAFKLRFVGSASICSRKSSQGQLKSLVIGFSRLDFMTLKLFDVAYGIWLLIFLVWRVSFLPETALGAQRCRFFRRCVSSSWASLRRGWRGLASSPPWPRGYAWAPIDRDQGLPFFVVFELQ